MGTEVSWGQVGEGEGWGISLSVGGGSSSLSPPPVDPSLYVNKQCVIFAVFRSKSKLNEKHIRVKWFELSKSPAVKL